MNEEEALHVYPHVAMKLQPWLHRTQKGPHARNIRTTNLKCHVWREWSRLSCQSCTAEEKYSFDLRMIIWMVFSWNLDYFHHITSIMTASYVKFSSHFPILLSLSRYTMHQHLCNILPSIIINVMSTFSSDIFQHLTWYHYISSPIRCFRTDAAKYGVLSSADFKSSF